MTDASIEVGDVCLDLAQGRPVHVIEVHDGDAGEWSEENDYDLTENYGNSRLGATEDDRVLECVYCSSIKSEPSKSYAFPESRLARVETEQADGGRTVYERIQRATLVDLFMTTYGDAQASSPDALFDVATHSIDPDLVEEAEEIADAEVKLQASMEPDEESGFDDFGEFEGGDGDE